MWISRTRWEEMLVKVSASEAQVTLLREQAAAAAAGRNQALLTVARQKEKISALEAANLKLQDELQAARRMAKGPQDEALVDIYSEDESDVERMMDYMTKIGRDRALIAEGRGDG